DEFFAAKAVCANIRTCLERLGDGLEHRIADGMSVCIVDRLEMIEVDDGQSGEAFGAKSLELLLDRPPVKQSRQWVRFGQMLEQIGRGARAISLAFHGHEAVCHAKHREKDF